MSYPGPFGVEGKVAFITGAGSGLGIEFATIMAQAGADVVCADIDLTAAEATAKKVDGIGRAGLALRCDVTSETEVGDAFAAARQRFRRVDVLFNNAGIADPAPPRSTSSAPTTG